MTSETCANCGLLEKFHPVWSLTGTERVLCEKFKHQNGKFVSLYQNHSPQNQESNTGGSGVKPHEDTESEEIKTETQVVNDRLNSSGSDDASSLSDYIIDYDGKKAMHILYPVISQARVKESVQKLKEEFWVNEVIIARIDKIFGKKLI